MSTEPRPTSRAGREPRPSQGASRFDAAYPLTKVFSRLRRAAKNWQAPALELVAEHGGQPFHVLVGTLLSLRTRDGTTLPACRRLLALAPDAPTLAGLPERAIAKAIYPVAFYRVKAGRLRQMAALLCAHHEGKVPADMEALLELPGVGPKTANLTLSLGFGKPAICVDVHVHRILNRLGALVSPNPHATELLLRANLPRRNWSSVNSLLVPFGQTLCTPTSPHCSTCPVGEHCQQLGVARRR